MLRTLWLKVFIILLLVSLLPLPSQPVLAASAPQAPQQPTQQEAGPFPLFIPVTFKSTDKAAPATEDGWLMAGANPERSSWTPMDGQPGIEPLWFKPFKSYINPKFHIIAAYNLLYVSTANGLYALDAASGAEKWVFPTEMPLGNSPTIANKVLYVGGLDKNLYALDAQTGKLLWKFAATSGIETNPVVAETKVFVGSRDGYLYAIHTAGDAAGSLAWKYKTGGPIQYSAAYKDGTIYFASNDNRAYALSAADGSLLWRTKELSGNGFLSWWPVVYQDWVIFAGSNPYRAVVAPGPRKQLETLDLEGVFPHNDQDPRGTLAGPLSTEPGAWVPGTPTLNASQSNVTPNGATVPITEYLETYPWRRTVFVLNRSNGQEYTTDFDQDGKPEYAPFLWQGTDSGNRYPPIVGSDGVLYMSNAYMSDPYIGGGQITGWKVGTPFLSIVSEDWAPVDEPFAYSAGGSTLFWNLCCDREAGFIDIRYPYANMPGLAVNQPFGPSAVQRERYIFNYNLASLIPGYSVYYTDPTGASFGRNGVYSNHGNQNPMIPYQGRLYVHRSNTLIAFGQGTGAPVAALPAAEIHTVSGTAPQPTPAQLKAKLAAEVQKIISAGHLRTAFAPTGLVDPSANRFCGSAMNDYWHAPGDVLLTLINALPYLPASLQTSTKAYLQSEFDAYSPVDYVHTGFSAGAGREFYSLVPDVLSDLPNYGPLKTFYDFAGWRYPPHAFYAMWKYAGEFGGAKAIFDASKDRLETPPSDDYLRMMPHVHNAYIAGYIGYLNLEELAGYPESAGVRTQLNRLLALRATTFTKDASDVFFSSYDYYNYVYCRAYNVSANFMYMVPELADYLQAHALPKVQAAIDEYNGVAPYWFVSRFDVTFGEGVIAPLYDYHALFQAKAMILDEPYAELVKYLDVPAMETGDLFYIDNLVAAIAAGN